MTHLRVSGPGEEECTLDGAELSLVGAGGHALLQRSLRVVPGKETKLDLALTPVPGGLGGWVVNGTGQPVADAEVRLELGGVAVVRTKRNGAFRFDRFYGDRVGLRVRVPGHRDLTLSSELEDFRERPCVVFEQD